MKPAIKQEQELLHLIKRGTYYKVSENENYNILDAISALDEKFSANEQSKEFFRTCTTDVNYDIMVKHLNAIISDISQKSKLLQSRRCNLELFRDVVSQTECLLQSTKHFFNTYMTEHENRQGENSINAKLLALQHQILDNANIRLEANNNGGYGVRFGSNSSCDIETFWNIVLNDNPAFFLSYPEIREQISNLIPPCQEMLKGLNPWQQLGTGNESEDLKWFINVVNNAYGAKNIKDLSSVKEKIILHAPNHVKNNVNFISTCVDKFGYKNIEDMFSNYGNSRSDHFAFEKYKIQQLMNNAQYRTRVMYNLEHLSESPIYSIKNLMQLGIKNKELLPDEYKPYFKQFDKATKDFKQYSALINGDISINQINKETLKNPSNFNCFKLAIQNGMQQTTSKLCEKYGVNQYETDLGTLIKFLNIIAIDELTIAHNETSGKPINTKSNAESNIKKQLINHVHKLINTGTKTKANNKQNLTK